MGYRYIGNKSRLVGSIVELVQTIARPGARIADPMCGTASVSVGLARVGYSVAASDELTFPVLHAKARLLCKRAPRFAYTGGYQTTLDHLNNLRAKKGFFYREYSAEGQPSNGSRPRSYLTGINASKIDSMREEIANLYLSRALTKKERDLLAHDLILATNRVANIAGTYGYYRSRWNQSSLEHVRLEPTRFEPTPGKHVVTQGRVETVSSRLEADLCYLDPPYTKRQYAGNYHLLETLGVGDEPEPVGEGGLRDWYGQYSDFCSRRRVRAAFEAVLTGLDVRDVLVSYSEDGLIPPHEMLALLRRFGPTKRHTFVLQRYRSNGGKPGSITEHVYHIALR